MKTAVEWLEEQVIKFHNWKLNPVFDENCFDEIELRKAIQQAKEMEKEQIGYSEEEVLVLLHKRDNHNIDNPNTFNGWLTPKEWFEQFKQQEQ